MVWLNPRFINYNNMDFIKEAKERLQAYKDLGSTVEPISKFVEDYVINLYEHNKHPELMDYEIEKFVRNYLHLGDKIYTCELDYEPNIDDTIFTTIRSILISTLKYILNIELNNENKNNK